MALLAAAVLTPKPATARQSDEWAFTLAPLYVWATDLDGQLTVGNRTAPIFLDFADALDILGGTFSFHFEAQRGRWGILTDLDFLRLSSGSRFVLSNRTVDGNIDLDNTMFEAGASYLLSDRTRFAVIGGLRTYSLSPQMTFSTPGATVEPVDTSRTSANVFAGFTYRPRLAEKWNFVSRADIGGGDAELTWSGMLGLDYRVRPSIGVVFGYKALGIDVGSDADDPVVTEYDVTHYGPIVGLELRWGRR